MPRVAVDALGGDRAPGEVILGALDAAADGIEVVLYGPAGLEGTAEAPDNCILISEMVLAAKVLALTAMDVCNLAG